MTEYAEPQQRPKGEGPEITPLVVQRILSMTTDKIVPIYTLLLVK